MIYIENEHWSAAIHPAGAELSSLQSKKTGEELIWQREPSVWAGAAPVLFPIVGILKEGKTTIDGADYAIPKHGFARNSTFSVIEQLADRLQLRLEASEQTLAVYPFRFQLDLIFELKPSGLHVINRVTNLDTRPMPFNIGSHPAFALNLATFNIEDYQIEFNQAETLDLLGLDEAGCSILRTPGFLKETTGLPLSRTLFDEDALMFTQIKSDQITLRRPADDWHLTVFTHGAPDLGIWAKPGAAYVCIEPWYGYNDPADHQGPFETRPNVITLPPQDVFDHTYTIEPG